MVQFFYFYNKTQFTLQGKIDGEGMNVCDIVINFRKKSSFHRKHKLHRHIENTGFINDEKKEIRVSQFKCS